FSIFLFSSRRRHTRSKRDWSSDVCSSDLPAAPIGAASINYSIKSFYIFQCFQVFFSCPHFYYLLHIIYKDLSISHMTGVKSFLRSEERRVGKECRYMLSRMQ